MRERENLKYKPRRARDRATVLLVLGTLLLFPPVIGISLIDAKVAGVPFPLVYIFVVWVVLIVGALRLAKPLADIDQPSDAGPRNTADGS